MNLAARKNSRLVALTMALLVFSSTWFYIRNIPLGEPPDEMAHLTYVNDIAANGHLIPDYRSSTILGSGQKNYLIHPPLYYTALGLFGRAFSWDSLTRYKQYRALSALLVAAGVFFWILVAFNFGFNLIGALVITATSLAIPMFPYLAGSINNDNLCYFGVALFFYGFSLLESSLEKAVAYAAVGFFITALTKATGTLFLISFFCAWALMNHRQALEIIKSRTAYRVCIPAAAICAAYYFYIIIVYHTPFPSPGKMREGHSLPLDHLNFLQFAAAFTSLIWERLPVVLTGQKSFDPLSRHLHPLFYFMVCAPVAAWAISRPFAGRDPARKGEDAFFIALLITAVAHFWTCWQGYLNTGIIGGIQPRYYNYMIPGIFLFSLRDSRLWRVKQWTLLVVSLMVVILIPNIGPRAAIEHHVYQRLEQAPSMAAPADTATPSNTLPLVGPSSGAPAGYFRVTDSSTGPVVTGWSIDTQSVQPPRAIWVSIHGKLIGTTQLGVSRPDVVAALKNPDALYSGFVIRIDKSQSNIPPCDIALRSEQLDGTLADLINVSCKH